MADYEETAAVLAAIDIAYPGRRKIPVAKMPTTLALWQGMLSDLPEGSALGACRALVACREHPPAISEIRSQALSVTLGKGRPEAGEAWGEVSRAFGSCGRDRQPEWSTPAITLAVRAVGGWRHLCSSTNTTADRARFLENYTGVLERASREVLTGQANSVSEALEQRLPMRTLPAPRQALEAQRIAAELGRKLKR